MKQLKTFSVIAIAIGLLFSGATLKAQTTGFWPDNLNNPTLGRTSTTTNALGIGTNTPISWAEIFYCPPFGTDQKGLVVTKFDCRFGQTGTNNNGNDGIMPEGYNPNPGPTVAWIPALFHFYNSFNISNLYFRFNNRWFGAFDLGKNVKSGR